MIGAKVLMHKLRYNEDIHKNNSHKSLDTKSNYSHAILGDLSNAIGTKLRVSLTENT